MSEMKRTIKLKSPKILTKKTLKFLNLLFEEYYLEVVLQYCERSPHRYEIPQQCMSCEKRFRHSYIYLLHKDKPLMCTGRDSHFSRSRRSCLHRELTKLQQRCRSCPTQCHTRADKSPVQIQMMLHNLQDHKHTQSPQV